MYMKGNVLTWREAVGIPAVREGYGVMREEIPAGKLTSKFS